MVECHAIWNAREFSGRGVLNRTKPDGSNMSHMVVYRGTDGSPGYHQADEVHDAVAFVEQLRNEEGVEEAKIFRMEQVTFEYKPYFRVELTSSEPSLTAGAAKPAVAAAPSAPAEKAAEAEVVEATEVVTDAKVSTAEAPAASSTESNGDVGARRGLFGR